MQSVTQVLSSGSLVITKDMNILAFSMIGLSDSAAFSYQGTAKIPVSGGGSDLASAAISFSGQVAYNSRVAPSNQPWDGVIISVSVGNVGVELSTN